MNYVSMDYIVYYCLSIGECSEECNNHSTIDPGPYDGCEQELITTIILITIK
jgi:hypothetical protein